MNRELTAVLARIAELVKAREAVLTALALLEDYAEQSRYTTITDLCRTVVAEDRATS